MVIMFEIWRYFPLSFLFILARMQSIPADIYEAAEMDGAHLSTILVVVAAVYHGYFSCAVFATLYLDL